MGFICDHENGEKDDLEHDRHHDAMIVIPMIVIRRMATTKINDLGRVDHGEDDTLTDHERKVYVEEADRVVRVAKALADGQLGRVDYDWMCERNKSKMDMTDDTRREIEGEFYGDNPALLLMDNKVTNAAGHSNSAPFIARLKIEDHKSYSKRKAVGPFVQLRRVRFFDMTKVRHQQRGSLPNGCLLPPTTLSDL